MTNIQLDVTDITILLGGLSNVMIPFREKDATLSEAQTDTFKRAQRLYNLLWDDRQRLIQIEKDILFRERNR